MSLPSKLTAAAIQMHSGADLTENLAQAGYLVGEAARQGAELVVLPEYFYLMPADERERVALAEDFGHGRIQQLLADLAREHGIWLLGGTVPLAGAERAKMYNSSLLFEPSGTCATRYDKIHLFGYDAGEMRYAEADTMSPGDAVATAATPWGPLRLSVCYDLRFPELYRHAPAPGLISAPAAFTHATGQAHWELLLRSRAVENLAFVIGAGQCGLHPGNKRTFGNSMIADPWGNVLARREDGPGVVLAELDLTRQHEWRTRLPALQHRRL